MVRKYPNADLKILYGKAAGKCAMPKCRIDIVLEQKQDEKRKQIGKIAHIVAHSTNGPRADDSYPKEKLDAYDNWVLLCPTCHDTVDALDSKYSVSDLLNIKSKHEEWVTLRLDESMSEVSFAELEVASKAIASGKHFTSSDFSLISPEEKIEKNNLSGSSKVLIVTGLSRSSEVREYLYKQTQIDDEFVYRLKGGFIEKYNELSKSILGDSLFMAMLDFAQAGQTEFKHQAASLAILCHLFELCDIFEK